MTNITSTPDRVILSDEALFQEIDGEGVILDLATSHYFGLDPVGTRLWQLLSENGNLPAAIDRIEREYDVARDQLVSDVLDLLAQLEKAGLATVG